MPPTLDTYAEDSDLHSGPVLKGRIYCTLGKPSSGTELTRGLHVLVKKLQDKQGDISREAHALVRGERGRGWGGGHNMGAALVQVVLAANMMFRHDSA